MRPLRRAPLRCDITLLTPLFIFVCTRDILQEKQRKEKKRQCKRCNYYYYCSVQLRLHVRQHFFHISILSTDLILFGESHLLQDYKLQG